MIDRTRRIAKDPLYHNSLYIMATPVANSAGGSGFAMSNHLLTACDKGILPTNDSFDAENLI